MHDEKHVSDYIILYTGLAVLIALFFLFRYNRLLQLIIGGFTAVFYILWGIIHHILENRLTKLVIAEYVLFGVLAFLLLFSALEI